MPYLTVADIMDFLQSLIFSFQDAIFIGFVLMITFTILFNLKRLLVDGLL